MAHYSVVATARTPQQLTGPVLSDLGPLTVAKLTYRDTLSDIGSISFSVQTDGINNQIKSRLRELNKFPIEIKVYRDNDIVAAGPITGYQIQGEDNILTVRCASLLYYTRYMMIVSDYIQTGIDAYTAGKYLVDQWQDLDYGNFGIDTTGIGTSGVTRDYTFDGHGSLVYDLLKQISRVDNGFDISVDPSTRALMFESPQGQDLSSSVHFDRKSIRSSSVNVSVAAGDIASDVHGHGEPSGANDVGETVHGNVSNNTVRTQFGRTGLFSNFRDIADAQTLTDSIQSMLDARSNMYFQPGPNMDVIEELPSDSYGVGDTVTYSFDSGLGVFTEQRRIFSKQVEITDDHVERVTVQFE